KGLATFNLREAAEINGQVDGAGTFSIEHEEYYFPVISIMNCRGDHLIDGSSGFGFALRRVNLGLQHAAVSVLGDQFEGMKDRLAPSRAARFRKNRRNDVNQLGQTRGFDPIRIV